MKSQIYSMQSIEDAKICLEAGADRIGVLASERCGEFPCEVKEKDALKILKTGIGRKGIVYMGNGKWSVSQDAWKAFLIWKNLKMANNKSKANYRGR